MAHTTSPSITYPYTGTGLSFLPQSSSTLQSFTPSLTFPYGTGTGLGSGWGIQPFTYSQSSLGGLSQSLWYPSSFTVPWQSSYSTFLQPSYSMFLQPSFGAFTGSWF